MTTPRVFILAAGSARRFNGCIKQLLPVAGEPIIRRTIRQVREHKPDAAIWVVTWHPDLMFPDVAVIDTGTQPPQLADSMLWSKPLWGDRTIFLLGDVVYGDQALRDILEYSGPLAVIGRDHCRIKPNSERFALTFPGHQNKTVAELLRKSTSIFANTAYENIAGIYKICLASQPAWKRIHCTDYPVHSLLRPFRDYFVWHVLGGPLWYPDTFRTILVDDDMTTDIDTPEDYAAFLELGK